MSPDPKAASRPITPDACWKVLEGAAASDHLKRATRLKEFLYYVGKRSIKEGSSEIHEQEIGQAVFGRKDSYDTSQDNIVRVSATELRRRVDAYFAAEGKDEPLIFEIPRGSYTPIFHWRTEAQAADSAKPLDAEVPGLPAVVAPWWRTQLPLLIVSTVALVLAVVCVVLWRENRSLHKMVYTWDGQPALAAFWPRFLDSTQDTDIVLADTSFAIVEDMMKQSYPLSDYLNRSYINQIHSFTLCTTDNKVVSSVPFESIAARNNGSFGDFQVAQRIEALHHGSTSVHVSYAREFTADSVKRDNVILIGSRKSNPWVDLFTEQMNFLVKYDAKLDQSFVQNLHPRAGEQAMYLQPSDPYASLGYSVIAYLPNPSRTGSALIIEGTNAEATNAAGEFVTSEAAMSNFFKKFPGTGVPFFEILLKTSRMSGTPLQAEVVAYRTY
ncbi:MAG: hypothetical protein ABR957_13400 [Terracidiphilus sp.]|jgi:hypothetical protein